MHSTLRRLPTAKLRSVLALLLSATALRLCAGTGSAPINEALITQTLYVSPAGSDTANGSLTAPFATLRAALARAATLKNAGTGVRVRIAPGTYREGAPMVNPTASSFAFQYTGFNSPAPIVIEGAGWSPANPINTGDVIISGSEDWSGGWTKNSDGTWSKDWPYNWGVPASGVSFGVSDAFLRRELVHVNGQTYYQVNPPAPYTNLRSVNGQYGGFAEGGGAVPGDNLNGGRLTAAEGSFWVTDAVRSADYSTLINPGKITIKLPANASTLDLASAANKVEVTTKFNPLQIWRDPTRSGPTNVILRNLTFQHAGGGYGALIQNQENLVLEDCRFIKNKHGGMTITTSRNVTIRRSEFSDNGESGAGMATNNGLLDRCLFLRNSRQGEILGYTGWSVCGIKFYTLTAENVGITAYRCEARDNRSTGFWWDTGNSLCEMLECVSTGHSTNGTFIEDNNSPGNNYENLGTGTRGTTGIPNLGSRPTVTAIRSIFAKNRPAADALAYRPTKGRGIFTSENENAVIDGCLVYDNDVQLSAYDNSRAEIRNVTFRNSLVAAQNSNQRLYAVGSTYDSGETITVRNTANQVVATLKGGWFAFFDGLSGTTNDNRYFYPSATAFFNRTQRWGTDQWFTNNASRPGTATLDLAGWRSAHLNNPNNFFTDKTVDSRSTLTVGAYDETKPLVAIRANVPALAPLADGAPTAAFTVTRVSPIGYAAPLTLTYAVRASAGDAVNGTDFEALTGTITIPANERSAEIPIRSTSVGTGTKPLVVTLVENPAAFVTAGATTASLNLLPSSNPTTRLTNLSVRTTLAANQILTVGFTLQGGRKPMLVRAAGPSLAALGVTGAMPNPTLSLFNGSTLEATNDDWDGALASAHAALGAFPFASSTSLDAALLRALDGGRTAQVSGPAAGNVIVEVYDADVNAAARLINLSALNTVGPGGGLLIAGFTIIGPGTKNLLIRAAGPSLNALGVTHALADPKLELFNAAQTRLVANDDYPAELAPIFLSVGAFSFTPGGKDAALIVSLPPGGYTAQISGGDGATGAALIEVYELN